MIRFRLGLALILCGASVAATAQNIIWHNHYGDEGHNALNAGMMLAGDGTGNVYATGRVGAPSMDLDGNVIDVVGGDDILIARIDSLGQAQWALRFGGECEPSAAEMGELITYDAYNDRLLIGGIYSSNATFGDFELPGGCDNELDMFIAAVDTSGDCLWASGSRGRSVRAAAILANDDSEVLVFGKSTGPGQTTFMGSPDIVFTPGSFLATYNDTGNIVSVIPTIWNGTIRKVEWSGIHWLMCGQLIALDTLFDEPFEATTPGSDGFLALSATDGSNIWLTQVRADSAAAVFHCKTSSTGLILTVGSFYGDGYFGNDTVSGTPSVRTFFYAAYESDGTLRWVHTIDGPGLGRIQDLELSAQDEIHLMGQFSGTIELGGAGVDAVTSQDIFMAKLDTVGDCSAILHMGHTTLTSGGSMITDNEGVVASFGYDSTMVIGPTVVPASVEGLADLFIARFDSISGFTGLGHAMIVEEELVIYANPNNGLCTIDLPNKLMLTSNLLLSIYSQNGQLVQRVPLQQTTGGIKLDIRAQAKGVYHVELGDGIQRYTGRIVFE